MLMESEICQDYVSGLSIKSIQNKYSISKHKVNKILKENNITKKLPGTIPLSENLIEKCKELYLEGISTTKIAKLLNINDCTIARHLKKQSIILTPNENKRKYALRENLLDTIDTQEKAYFLGFMWSDGNVSKRKNNFKISLNIKDKDILYKFAEMFYIDQPMVDISKNTASLRIYSKKLTDRLINLGCTPAKSFTCKYPELNDELDRHFIRGLFDGDGCIYINKTRILVDYTGNEFLCRTLIDKIKLLGIENIYTYKRHKDRQNNIISFRINKKKHVKLFLDYIYDNNSICLTRKYEKYMLAKQL
jgi:intein/homing endonuclease